ncbi:hypothetical protein [Actinoplanes sp. TFC3]|uniref:hypothetical protein n=1 Tax=Actinoplanes sp. TFC3 TaxID=1710355 RepID=UPI000833D0F5|nr:hypothetical protein [Actinoplanes sp. TFC3]
MIAQDATQAHWWKARRWLDAVRDGLPEPDDFFLAGLARHAAMIDASKALCDTGSPVADFYGARTAEAVALWAAQVHGFGYSRAELDADRLHLLDQAYRNAPVPVPSAAPLKEAAEAADGLTGSVAVAERHGQRGTGRTYVAEALAVDAAAAGEAEMLPSLEAGTLAVVAAGFESVRFRSTPYAMATQEILDGCVAVDAAEVDAVVLPVRLDGSGDVGLILIGYDALEWIDKPASPGTTGLARFSAALCDPSPLLCRLAPETACAEGPLGRARIRQAAYLGGLVHRVLAAGPGSGDAGVVRAGAALAAVRAAFTRAAQLADNRQPYAGVATEVLALAADTALAAVRLARTEDLRLRIRLEALRFGRPEQLWLAAGRRRMTEEGRKRT